MCEDWRNLIAADTRNKKMWDQVLEKEMFSRTDLLNQVKGWRVPVLLEGI